MPFLDSIMKYLPLIQTGLTTAGQYLGSREQQQGLERASGITEQAKQDAMHTILGLYDEGQASLAPYRNVGPAALNRLQELAYGQGNIPAPASIQQQPVGNTLSRFSPQTAATGSGPAAVQNAMMTNPQGQAQQQGGRNALLGGVIGGVGAPLGLGLTTAAMLGAPAGLGLGLGLGAIGGPIGMGLGLAGSYIASQFGKNNPYKVPASLGIEQVAKNVWGTNKPGIAPEQLTSGYVADMLKGRIPIAEGKQKINADIDAWVQGMKANGTPQNVIDSSVRTQMSYLAPLKGVWSQLEQQQPAMR